MSEPRRSFFACLLALLGAACGGERGVDADALDLQGRNLLLVSIDTLRADRTSPYGHAIETPALQRLADEGVTFETALSPVPMTQPAHTSLFTGLYPGRHGVRDNVGTTLTDEARTLAEVLREAGYQTGAVVASKVLARLTGLDQGFDSYDDRFRTEELDSASPNVERRAREVRLAASQWLAARDRARPFALFVHFFDPHTPHDPPPLFRERYPDRLLDGEIAFVDRNLAQLIEQLESEGELERTLVVVLSDHGESLHEHGEEEHGLFLYDATQHVPLIVRLPGVGAPRGRRVATPVTLVDVLPTVLELLGLPALESDGVSLAPLLAGGSIAPRALFAETHYPLFYRWSPSYSLRDGAWKYIHAPHAEVYDLARDAAELENLLEREPQRASGMRAALERKLEEWRAAVGTAAAGGHLSLQELAALGYGGGAPVDEAGAAELPDAKDKVALYATLAKALGLMGSERWEEARVLLVEVLRQEPGNPSALLNMGSVLARTGRYAEAEQHLKACLALQPDNQHAKATLAMSYLVTQRLDEAEALFREILQVSPRSPEPRFFLGQVLAQRGKLAEALECFEAARREQPNLPMLQESIDAARRALGQDRAR
jgi:arylsulfatase A-like enzyme/Tfp pilus assembly protein PilF